MTFKFGDQSAKIQILHHHSLPFKWPPNLEVKLPDFKFCITTPYQFKSPPNLQVKLPNFKFCITPPYPSNDLQIWRSNCQISNSASPLPTLQMTSKFTTPYPSNDLQIRRLICKISNSSSPLHALQMTSKLGGQNAKFQILHHQSLPSKWASNLEVKLQNFKFFITTLYPSNDLQIWRSNCRIWNSASPLRTLQMSFKFGGQTAEYKILHHHSLPFKWPANQTAEYEILHHHSVPFKWPPNLEVKLRNFKFCITTSSNSASPRRTLQMTSKFGGQTTKFQILHHHSLPFKWPPNFEVKLENMKFSITTPYPSLQISRSNCRIWNQFGGHLKGAEWWCRTSYSAVWPPNLEGIWRVGSGDAEFEIAKFQIITTLHPSNELHI